jgi:hypothetical protein
MITTATVYTILFIHIGVILVATSYFVFSAALAPNITARGRMRFSRQPWLPTIIGVLVSAPWVIAAMILMGQDRLPAGKFAGAVLGCLWILSGLIGSAAIAQHVGRGGRTGDDSWVTTVRGGLFLTLTWVLPLVGWLGMLPLTLATGVGCLVLGLFPTRPIASTPAPDSLPAPA